MRIIIVLLLGAALGWIGGSLYPAPPALLALIPLHASEQPNAAGDGQSDAAVAPPSQPPPSSSAPRRAAVDEQTLAQYRTWIHEARLAHPYSDSEDRMYALMLCESRGQATIVSGAGHSGLFQYSAATWRAAWNSYRDENILDPRAQIFATALAFQRNMQSQWGGCYTNAH